jgi:hypothetical protein
MRRRSSRLAPSFASILLLSAVSFSMSSLSCGGDSGGTSPKCASLDGYTASVTTPLSFATDIYPILSSTTTGMGCGQMTICHGNPSVAIDPVGAKMLSFTAGAAAVKTALLGNSVNAPNMKMVVASNVGSSFLAYKISDKDGLECVKSMCTKGNSVGTMTACGDPMPNGPLGVLTAADRTKILDWIALGAAD